MKNENAMKKCLLAILLAGLMVAIACQVPDDAEQATKQQETGMDTDALSRRV